MLSLSQLVIKAYVDNCAVLCRECGENEGLPARDALCAYVVDSELNEEGDGVYCDAGGAEISEPWNTGSEEGGEG